MISKICDNIYRITGIGGNSFYFLDIDEKILINTGDYSDKDMIEKELSSLVKLDNINTVIFTDLTHEQIGNFELFKNAKFCASKYTIEDLERNRFNVILSNELSANFNISLLPLLDNDELYGLKVLWTPGHTRGSICVWYEKEKMMFTGDTMLDVHTYSTFELPTAAPDLFDSSLVELKKYDIKILCPGKDIRKMFY